MSDDLQEPLHEALKTQVQSTQAHNPLIIELLNKIKSHIEPMIVGINEVIKQNEEKIQSELNGISSLFKLGASIAPSLIQLVANFEQLPDRTRNALNTLAQHGWFLVTELSFPELLEIEQMLKEEKIFEADEYMVDLLKTNLNQIENRMILHFPNRAKIIKAAFKAHIRSEYELSVPVFLTQADGFFFDTNQLCFFLKKNKLPETAALLERYANEFSSIFLHPLSVLLPIAYSKPARIGHRPHLNRHQVIHGEIVDYGTEINSYKAISLASYIASVLKEEEYIRYKS